MFEKTIQSNEFRELLQRDEPVTVRRVLPRGFISRYIRQYLRETETMMKSFQAILTFPTQGRDLPEQLRKQMQAQFSQDIRDHAHKLDGEVGHLIQLVQTMRVMQSHIMLHVISDKAFPFCLLNTFNYRTPDRDIVPCYVTLWARQQRRDYPIQVWMQLVPQSEDLWGHFPFDKLRTDPHLVRLPTGQANILAFNTALTVNLYDVPSAAEATLQGKTLPEMIKEMKQLRESLVRRKDMRGNFLHFSWTREQPNENAAEVQINEALYSL